MGKPLKHPVKYTFQGIELDPGFMFQKSKDIQRVKSLESYNGHNAYLLLYCLLTTVMCGPTTKVKQPPILWLNLFLSRVRPSCRDFFARTYQGGEMSRHPKLRALFTTHKYFVEQTGTDTSSQIGGVERGHGSIGGTLRTMHHGANCPLSLWPFSFYEYIRLSNLYPRDGKTVSKITEATGVVMDSREMIAWGCHVHVKPPQRRSARLLINNRRGVYLGPTATHKNF